MVSVRKSPSCRIPLALYLTQTLSFPGGDAGILFDSIQRILALPDATRIFLCHDYQPDGRELEYLTTVADERNHNIHIGANRSKESFVALREARDKTLDMPRLILPSLQVNMRAGHFPEPEDNNRVYLKLPINAFKK